MPQRKNGAGAPGLIALDFPGTRGRMVLPSDPALMRGLADCLTGWTPQQSLLRRPPANALAAVAKTGDSYDLHSRHLDRPMTGLTLASAVCALIADLSQDWSEAARGVTGLHGGAVMLDGQLLLLTGPARAGKSTLITRLAAAPGVTFFCDDVLPVTTSGDGIALGIAPRLRLPVPEGSASLWQMAQQDMILADDRYGYVRVPDQAAHGRRAPLGAILLLDRQKGEAARFHVLDPAEALSAVLRQSITGYGSAGAAFARVRTLTRNRLCLRLVYSDLEEAAALILAGFAQGATRPDPLPAIAARPVTQAPPIPVPPEVAFRRNPLLRIRRHGSAAYLWQAGEPTLWELNPMALGIWQMLEIPGNAKDLATILADLFPQIAPDQLITDTARLLSGMQAAGLVSTVEKGAP